MPEAVIFDIDNTLYDYTKYTEHSSNVVVDFASRRYGIPEGEMKAAIQEGKRITKELLQEGAAQHSRVLFFQHALEVLHINAIGAAWEMEELYWGSMLQVIQPFAGVIEVLRNLKGKGLKLGICTDMTAAIQQRKLLRLGVSQYFDVMVCSEETGFEKPHDSMFRLSLQKLGAEAGRAVMVGDNWHKDIKGAIASGMYGAWYHAGGKCHINDKAWQFSSYQDGSLEQIIQCLSKQEG